MSIMPPPDQTHELLHKYWGFDALRPLQAEVVDASKRGEDALVVMPTGGGKSLCFQLPALMVPGLTLVVSPLIALMKDQVDGLRFIGYPAAALNSTVQAIEEEETWAQIRSGELRLLYVSPERLVMAGVAQRLAEADGGKGVTRIAIDEAHCISQWGHDFRPEYRQIGGVRKLFPGVSVQAFTATATPRVRADIAEQLHLENPHEFIGNFDRPNLTYRIIPKQDRVGVITDAIRRYPDEAVIVYCISRKNTEEVAKEINARGLHAEAYHAGLNATQRKKISEDFAQERLNVVVATVAFGMGIDRANVRCVVHESMPKSIEGYTQETGRAGRDGLPSECIMLYNHGDLVRWKRVMEMNESAHTKHQIALLEEVRRFAIGFQCRHQYLSEYFGQTMPPKCDACDLCMDGVALVPDGTKIAHKILVTAHDLLRTGDRFGMNHLVGVLAGANTKAIRGQNHHLTRGYGCLQNIDRAQIQAYVYQLIDLGLLAVSDGNFPIIQATEVGQQLIRERGNVDLRQTTVIAPKSARRSRQVSGVAGELFESLREFRKKVAAERGIAAFMIAHDSVLQEIARVRPKTLNELRKISGIGEKRIADIGGQILEVVARSDRELRPVVSNFAPLFESGLSVNEAAERMGRAVSTVDGYLAEWVAETKPESVAAWVSEDTYRRVIDVASRVGAQRLRPIKDELEDATYTEIRIALAHAIAHGVLEIPVTINDEE